jgi:lipid-A-disaccharide synthase
VAAELARTSAALACLPVHLAVYACKRAEWRAEILGDLSRDPDGTPPIEIARLPPRPLSIFVACAERSGEIHACSLVRALRAELEQRGAPEARFTGIGGASLAAEGVRLLAEPVERSSMGFRGPLASLPYYCGVLRACAAHFAADAPDVVVPVDSPALHVPLARIAHAYRLPVVHFVAPQYWGWAPWRVHAYPRAVDRALTILPFEPAWFERHGVRVRHVGHPLLDALASVPPTRPSADARDLVVLPGSRRGVIERNLPWMLRAVTELRAAIGDVPVVIAQAERAERELALEIVRRAGAAGWARVEAGDLHAVLTRASAAFSVSGTILVDVAHHRLPAVVVYRLANAPAAWLARRLLTAPWFASVNLVAAREVYPEFSFAGDGPMSDIVFALKRAHGDREWRARCIDALDEVARRLQPPGACGRAAREVLAEAADGGGRKR